MPRPHSLEQREEGGGLHVGQLDLGGGGGHATVEHGVEDGAADGQHETVSGDALRPHPLAHQEVHVAQDLVVEQEGEALLHCRLRGLPVVHGLPVNHHGGGCSGRRRRTPSRAGSQYRGRRRRAGGEGRAARTAAIRNVHSVAGAEVAPSRRHLEVASVYKQRAGQRGLLKGSGEAEVAHSPHSRPLHGRTGSPGGCKERQEAILPIPQTIR